MRGTCALLASLFAITILIAPPAGAQESGDRLARFAELGRRLSEPQDAATTPERHAVVGELFDLVDAEILDNLGSGGPFASTAFLQERLDAFTSTWGGAGFRVQRFDEGARRVPLTIAVFTLPGPSPRGSVRAYGPGPSGGVKLLAASTHGGEPGVYPWLPARAGAAQLLVSWLGAASGPGGRPLDLELWRRDREHGIERVWSSAALFPEGLWALGVTVSRGEIAVRHEPRYPGWKPGCDGQTELIDVYRADARRDGIALARRRVINGWHRELQAAVARFVRAQTGGDLATVAQLVPDRALRAQLPRALALEPACDQPIPGAPPGAVVAATEERDGRMVPWSLTWRRAPGGWRLVRATPMLQ